MEAFTEKGPKFATETARLQAELMAGNQPDPEKLQKWADDMDATVEQWTVLVQRLNLSQDFQTREYALLCKAHLLSHDTSTSQIASLMRWQAECMRAMARNQPPPMPPSDVDLTKMMDLATQDPSATGQQPKQPPSIAAMTAAEAITEPPFTGNEPAFASEMVQSEHEQLCRDHRQLIEFGEKYDEFDPLGKLYYLDEVEKIQERWEVFFARFQLLGALNPVYIQQCNAFLASMGLDEEQYRELLGKAHELMREEAEAERNRVV